MSKLPVMDALQGHPLDGHLAGQKRIAHIVSLLLVFKKKTKNVFSQKLKSESFFCSLLWRQKEEQQDKWYDGIKWRTRLNKREITHTHTHSRCTGIRWREMGGLSGAQLNAVIRFEIQPYWLERWVWRRRFDRACSCPGGGDNTSALTQTMMDRVARGSRRG